MKSSLAVCLLLLTATLRTNSMAPASAFATADDVKREKRSADEPMSPGERRLLAYLSGGKRTSWQEALCGRWDDWCASTYSSDNPALNCCSRFVCKCNLWNSNCRCRSRLFSRRWS